MRRIEQDPEEIQQEEDAIARQAKPTHEQPIKDIAVRKDLGRLALREPVELGWDLIPDNIVLGEE